MELHINKSPHFPRVFSIQEHPSLTLSYQGTIFGSLLRMDMYKNGESYISVKQERTLIQSLLPFYALWRKWPALYFYQGNRAFGRSIELQYYLRYCFIIEDMTFWLRFHSGNYVSVWRDHDQIALLHTQAGYDYRIEYEPSASNDIELLALFCVIVDFFQFERKTAQSYHYLLRNDPYKGATNWKPRNSGK